MSTKTKEMLKVVSQEVIGKDIYSLWLQTDKIAENARPGQFVSLYTGDGSKLLPRPISICEADPETGLLEKKFTLPVSGDYPKDLVIFPDNRHIAVANHASNSITTFTVDYDKNIIVMNDKPHKVETPNSIHMWPVPGDWEPVSIPDEEEV